MELRRSFGLAALCVCVSVASSASTGPDDRQLTDPKSVVSVANAAARPVPLDDLYYTRNVFGPAWSPDGQEIVFTSDLAGRANLWKVRASGSWPIQLTQSDDRQRSAVWSPDGKWIVYQQDHEGDELWDLYAIPSDGGTPINLTNTPAAREQGPRWSHDGNTIAFHYKTKEGSQHDIGLLDWKTHKVRLLTHEQEPGFLWGLVAWSRDDRTIYAIRSNPIDTDENTYRIDVATGKAENLTPHQGAARLAASALSPDDKTLLLTADAEGGYPNVALLDVATRKITWVTDLKWEANSGTFSPDGKRFSYTVNQDGVNDAYVADSSTKKAEKVDLPHGLNDFSGNPTEFGPRSDQVIVSHEASNQPRDLWIYNLNNRRAEQLTFSSVASLHATPLPASQIVHYKSFDGRIITALLWVPFNLKRDGSNPALVLPHGGPTGQMVDYWNIEVAALTSRGYICIAPNPRGSTGYGMDFQQANRFDLGDGDLKDEIAGVDFLKATGYVDSKKIGITGGSYGGYLTLMAMGKNPEVWAAGVEEYGIINWLTMLTSSDPGLNEYLKGLLGDPEKNRKIYESASPITYIHSVKAPLLVLQGDNDPRVPKEEAQQVVDLLRKDGRIVDVHYYRNEGHGFGKRENQIDSIRRTLAWFDEYLLGKNPAAETAQPPQ